MIYQSNSYMVGLNFYLKAYEKTRRINFKPQKETRSIYLKPLISKLAIFEDYCNPQNSNPLKK
jgi:hypothetical protein